MGWREHHRMATTVVIVDDHAGFRRMAQRMLEDAGFDVVGEAVDGEGALAAVDILRPELVLLDIQLPDVDGIAVARRLAEAGTDAVIILTSSRSASDYGSRLAHSSARGFIPKAELSGPALVDLLGAAR
jgi:DNA-binding NarL/FixJ family response regulator